MEVGIVMPCSAITPPQLIAETAKAIEERGFASIWAPEHVIFFEEYRSKYPYADHGKLLGFDHGMMEPWTTLSYVAANTTRVRLGSSICLVPSGTPVYTAKQIADVDFLSDGRVDFGVGAGWLKEEFDALQVPFERRGARTSDYIRVMQALWTMDNPSYEGEFYTLPECTKSKNQFRPRIHPYSLAGKVKQHCDELPGSAKAGWAPVSCQKICQQS